MAGRQLITGKKRAAPRKRNKFDVIHPHGDIFHKSELSVPVTFTDEALAIWDAVISNVPKGWVSPENGELLVQYVRHVQAGRRISDLIDRELSASPFNIEAYRDLLLMQQRESRLVIALLRSMRLTQQSTIAPKSDTGSTGGVGKRPWEE